jgi:RimJ/RimL family protein N-acetyltransferase
MSDFTSPTAAKERFTKRFLNDSSLPRQKAIICLKEDQNKPLGWMNRYGDERFPSAWLIGICICEDDYLNKGFGAEAFRLWIDYLFANSDIHRLGFATYSFNPRMIRVGEKLGFTHEGTDREIIFWQNEWLDRLHFGLLRREWKARQCI